MRGLLSKRMKGLLSMSYLPREPITKFLFTVPLIFLVCYLPLVSMVDGENKDKVITNDYCDVIFLEFSSSAKGEIYRFIQRFHTGLTDEEELKLTELIYNESQKYAYDPELVLALIMVESSFYSKAVSTKGARGLMQLRPHVAKALAQEVGIAWDKETSIFDPEVNIRLGLYYLSKLILQFKDLKVAITAYNFGPTYTREMLKKGKPLPMRYANKVLKNYRKLSQKDRTKGLIPL